MQVGFDGFRATDVFAVDEHLAADKRLPVACFLAYVESGWGVYSAYTQVVNYVDSSPATEILSESEAVDAVEQTMVGGWGAMHRLPLIRDMRGNLSVGEFEHHVPFEVKRYFLVFDVPSFKTRGEHAHYQCEQFLLCVSGIICVVADDGKNRQEFLLDEPNKAVYLPPMTCGIQYKASPDAVLLVFASQHYDASGYIREYDKFIQLIQG